MFRAWQYGFLAFWLFLGVEASCTPSSSDGTEPHDDEEAADNGSFANSGHDTTADDENDAGNDTDTQSDDAGDTDSENETAADDEDDAGDDTNTLSDDAGGMDSENETAAGDEDAGDDTNTLSDDAGGMDSGNETAADNEDDAGDDTNTQSDDAGGMDSGNETTADDEDDAGDDTDAQSDDAGNADDEPQLDTCLNAPGQLGHPDEEWNTAVADRPLDAESTAIISYLEENHDTNARFQIDFSLEVLTADDTVPHHPFSQSGAFYSPDCDPAAVPVPDDGAVEGNNSYSCDNDGDCHLIVIDEDECRLFEMWRADIDDSGFEGGCLAIWNLDVDYPEDLRGEYCTSADAAGLPIAPLLFSADDVAAGSINHALRFILPNSHIRDQIYVRPGTHSTPATAGPGDSPPYSTRLRLKSDVDISGLNPAAQVVAQAMKTYGIILADGGNITFTAQSDQFTVHSWDDVGLGPHDLKSLSWSDFEVPALGERFTWDGDCVREPVTE